MTPYETIIQQHFQQGKTDALDLRDRASDMDGTGLIAEEKKVPVFDPDKDYSDWAVGSPVRELVDEEYQIFKLIQPYNAAHYDGTPATLPALWSICHTMDSEKAKPYMPPNGISGLYMLDEVCTKDGRVWRSTQNDNPYPPGEVGTEAYWEDLGEEVRNA